MFLPVPPPDTRKGKESACHPSCDSETKSLCSRNAASPPQRLKSLARLQEVFDLGRASGSLSVSVCEKCADPCTRSGWRAACAPNAAPKARNARDGHVRRQAQLRNPKLGSAEHGAGGTECLRVIWQVCNGNLGTLLPLGNGWKPGVYMEWYVHTRVDEGKKRTQARRDALTSTRLNNSKCACMGKRTNLRHARTCMMCNM